MKNITVEYIQCHVHAGVPKHNALREAIILALTGGRAVKFEFNNRPYTVNPGTVCDLVEEYNEKT